MAQPTKGMETERLRQFRSTGSYDSAVKGAVRRRSLVLEEQVSKLQLEDCEAPAGTLSTDCSKPPTLPAIAEDKELAEARDLDRKVLSIISRTTVKILVILCVFVSHVLL